MHRAMQWTGTSFAISLMRTRPRALVSKEGVLSCKGASMKNVRVCIEGVRGCVDFVMWKKGKKGSNSPNFCGHTKCMAPNLQQSDRCGSARETERDITFGLFVDGMSPFPTVTNFGPSFRGHLQMTSAYFSGFFSSPSPCQNL